MKTHIIILLFGIAGLACKNKGDNPPKIENPELVGSIEFSNSHNNSEIDKQVERNGIEILFAYYCFGGIKETEKLDQKLGLGLREDLRNQLFYGKSDSIIRIVKEWITDELDNHTKKERLQLEEKAIQWLNISRIVNSQFCETYAESFFESVYEIKPMKEIIHRYINPDIGQTTNSLSSAQMSDIEIDIWNYLSGLNKNERLKLIGEFMTVCSNSENK